MAALLKQAQAAAAREHAAADAAAAEAASARRHAGREHKVPSDSRMSAVSAGSSHS